MTDYTIGDPAHTNDLLLRDIEPGGNMPIDAMVASGDCFITIATSIDQYAETHPEPDGSLPAELEAAITTLLYLQRNYKITRKKPEYRQ